MVVFKFDSLRVVVNRVERRRIIRLAYWIEPIDRLCVLEASAASRNFLSREIVTLDDAFERLGVRWWPVLGDLRLESDPAVFLHLLGQFLNHLLLFEDRAVKPVHMRLHRRLDRIAALTLPVLQHVDGISMCIATLQVEHVLADPPMRRGL